MSNDEANLLKTIARDIRVVLAVTLAAAATGLLVDCLRPESIGWIYQSKGDRIKRVAESIKVSGPLPQQEIQDSSKSLTALEVLEQSRNEAVIIVDARPEIFHRFGHIPGAVSIPREAFERGYHRAASRLEAARTIIVYCSDSDCEDSRLVEMGLRLIGFKNILLFPGGWADWEEAGFPTETSNE